MDGRNGNVKFDGRNGNVKFDRNLTEILGFPSLHLIKHIFRTCDLQDTLIFQYQIEPEGNDPVTFFLDHFVVLHTHVSTHTPYFFPL